VRTKEDVVLGTPQYMAPEQASARHDELDGRTDQFALGAIAYEMLSGKPPFEGDNATQVMFKIVYESPEPIESRVADLPATVARAVTRAMSTRPEDRFADIAGFAAAISGRPVPETHDDRMMRKTAPASPVARQTPLPDAATARESQTVVARPTHRRRPIVPVLAGVAALAAVALGIRAMRHEVVVPRDAQAAPPAPAPAPDAPSVPGDSPMIATPPVPADAPSPKQLRPEPAGPRVPPAVTAALDQAERDLDAGKLDAAEQEARATTYDHEYPRADAILATIGCARHDISEAQGWMRRAGHAAWPAIRKRCAKLGLNVPEPD
jgi:serine/threonine-protein kinase